jgi:O-methyltransferase domain
LWTHRIQGEAHGILFDLPHVVRDAPALIQSRGLAERVTIEAGSFFERVPSGGDAYLLSHIIHDWSEEQCLAILDHCRRAMNSGSRLLVVEMVLPEGDTPHPGKIIDMAMLVAPGGRSARRREYGTLLGRRGYDSHGWCLQNQQIGKSMSLPRAATSSWK